MALNENDDGHFRHSRWSIRWKQRCQQTGIEFDERSLTISLKLPSISFREGGNSVRFTRETRSAGTLEGSWTEAKILPTEGLEKRIDHKQNRRQSPKEIKNKTQWVSLCRNVKPVSWLATPRCVLNFYSFCATPHSSIILELSLSLFFLFLLKWELITWTKVTRTRDVRDGAQARVVVSNEQYLDTVYVKQETRLSVKVLFSCVETQSTELRQV